VIDILCNEDGYAEHTLLDHCEIKDSIVCVELKKQDGEAVKLVDYSSAGKTWDKKSMCAAWLYQKEINE
jgi:hypothetical protein